MFATPAINAAFTFAEVIAKINDVPEEARRFSTLINRVRRDYDEALRLWPNPAVQARFAADLAEQRYVHGTIHSVKTALADIGRFVEKIRIQDRDGHGSVSMIKRSEWLWSYRSKVDSSERVLDTSHKSMLGAMHRMVTWISASSSLSALSGSGPPPYQEAVGGLFDVGELDDGLVVARRRMTKYDRREKAKSNVSISVTPGRSYPVICVGSHHRKLRANEMS